MKFICKLLSMTLLIWFTLCWNPSSAVEEQYASNDNTLNYILQNVSSTVNDKENDDILPYRDIFNNTIQPTQEFARMNIVGNLVLADNGFLYDNGYSVKTQGQVDVPAMKALNDFSHIGRTEEIEIIESLYPEINILGNPTSAYNCHSYAWHSNSTSNSFWINNPAWFITDVHTTFTIEEEDAQVGDIVVYYNSVNGIVHSAVITRLYGNSIICRSKWGASVLCEHEKDYVPENYKDVDGQTNCFIHRITPHNGPCEPAGINQHIRTCATCNYVETLNCSYTYTYLYDDMHNAFCSCCGHGYSGAFCTFDYHSNGNGTHVASCTACSNSKTENCYPGYTALSGSRHNAECSLCGFSVTNEICDYIYTSNGDGTHTGSCRYCSNTRTASCAYIAEYDANGRHYNRCKHCDAGHYADCTPGYTYTGTGSNHTHITACRSCGHVMDDDPQACTFAYRYNGVVNGHNTHIHVCTQCDHIQSGPTQCTYIGPKPCLACGCIQGGGALNNVEEDFTEN